ncbi:hypothetical protein [Cupriavidus basilensis]|uniref:hypothetical protein n=1 Tax=Cupriavidus basilensis TaxID=68895 RepID=UPI0011856CB2|nr:hypothetical protein [Cupriavidus basilensis]
MPKSIDGRLGLTADNVNEEPEANGRIEELPVLKARAILYISRRHLDNIVGCAARGRFYLKSEGGFQISLTTALAYRKANSRG